MTVSSDRRGRGSVRRVAMPDVVGLLADDAKIVLANAGFDRIGIHYTEDYVRQHEVIDQYPRSGLLVNRAVDITLRINRRSLVQFLPQVFQQTASNEASYLKGFLYIVQGLSDSVGLRLDRIHELFDPRTTDLDFMPWLASWMAVVLNPDWSELERRKMLMAATRLFPIRGTAKAIRDFVNIYVGSNVEIEENSWPFQGFRIGVHSTVGEDTVILPPMNLNHCFVVRLDKPASQTPEDEIIKIHQIIQNQKPAHTSYFLAFSDEAESGLMGTFMAIGMGGQGDEGGGSFGIGVGMDGVAFEAIGGGAPAADGLIYHAPEETDVPAAGGSSAGEGRKVPKAAAKSPRTSASGSKKTAGGVGNQRAKSSTAAATAANKTKSTGAAKVSSTRTSKKSPASSSDKPGSGSKSSRKTTSTRTTRKRTTKKETE